MEAHGLLAAHVHRGQVAAIVELRVEKESMLTLPQIQRLGEGLAMHVAAMKPAYVNREAMGSEAVGLKQVTSLQGMPIGALDAILFQSCLLEQAFVLDQSVTVAAHIQRIELELGGSIRVVRFWRHEAGAI
jgi:elongation factor Ts